MSEVREQLIGGFGLPMQGAVEWWGARAIQHRTRWIGTGEYRRVGKRRVEKEQKVPGYLEYLWDRQSRYPEEAVPRLKPLLNEGAVGQWLRKHGGDMAQDARMEERFPQKDGTIVVARMTPNNSYGYVYVGVALFNSESEVPAWD